MKTEDSEALAMLKAKRQELGTKALAEALGYSESTIRLACTGNYPGSLDKMLAEVRKRWLAVVRCPYVDEEIRLDECFDRSTSPRPYGGKAREQWWLACQECQWRGSQEPK